MAIGKNPNNVSRKEADEVFYAQVGEQTRRSKAKKDSIPVRKANLKKAQEIVDEANKKKDKK